jgi:tetratricopeptide (TPR) repeat protein
MNESSVDLERRLRALAVAQNARTLVGVRHWWLLASTETRVIPDGNALRDGLRTLLGGLGDNPSDLDDALDIAALLAPFWLSRGEWSEAERWFRPLLELECGNVERRSELARTLSVIARNRGELDRARAFSDRALSFARAGRDATLVATALMTATGLSISASDFDEAERLGHLAVESARSLGDPLLVSRALQALAMAYLTAGNLARARETYARCLDIDRDKAPSTMSLAHLYDSVAMCALYERDYPAAREHAREALDRARFEGSRVSEAWAQHHLAAVAWRLDRPAEARLHTERALSGALAVGYAMILVREIEEIAGWLAVRDAVFDAAVLLAGAERARVDLRAPQQPFETRDARERAEVIVASLRPDEIETARTLGAELSLPLVIERMRATVARVAPIDPQAA